MQNTISILLGDNNLDSNCLLLCSYFLIKCKYIFRLQNRRKSKNDGS